MKLALVNLPSHEDDPPLGLAYIAAYLREYAGFRDTVIVDEDDPLSALRRLKPDLVGISCLSFLFPAANRLAGAIRAELGVPVIAGGYHISYLPQHLAASNFDLGVIGEGEETMVELVGLLASGGGLQPAALRGVPGLVFRNERGESELSGPRPLIEPLDRIPFPARDLLRMKDRYLVPRKAGFDRIGVYTSILTSRGCPYQCVFCSPRLFWRKFRSLSPGRVADEVEALLGAYPLDGIMIWDDLFIANRPRLRQIVDEAEGRGITKRTRFCVFARADLIDDEMIALLKRLNVVSVVFGLESGSERMLRYYKKGAVTVADNYRALRLCKQHGMRTLATLIIGAPEETEADIEETRKLVRSPDLDQAVICHLTPLPGTETWEDAKRAGLVSEEPGWNYETLGGWGFHPDLVLTQAVSRERLEYWYRLIQEDVDRKRFGEPVRLARLRYAFHPHLLRRAAAKWRGYARASVRPRRT